MTCDLETIVIVFQYCSCLYQELLSASLRDQSLMLIMPTKRDKKLKCSSYNEFLKHAKLFTITVECFIPETSLVMF